ncbi:hypothetical protein E2C01_031632 [Portunus trituberculatus]|uniref:Uncharacterized protein n=1 Tax=Portunus trituberculatus TaxID=210409 RepID=A0A5B7EYM4_PORTR|nr:hypothetical protein [Portunus trituberculatus]
MKRYIGSDERRQTIRTNSIALKHLLHPPAAQTCTGTEDFTDDVIDKNVASATQRMYFRELFTNTCVAGVDEFDIVRVC